MRPRFVAQKPVHGEIKTEMPRNTSLSSAYIVDSCKENEP
ncbi:hypothetical protein LDFHOB_08350 [Candidatus Electronema aureum]